jgi:hypothetical protein
MPTKAQLVREAIAAAVRNVAGVGNVQSDGFWKTWVEETNLPAVFVILEDDDSGPGPTRSKTVAAHFRLATILAASNPQDAFDDLRGAIETLIEADPSLGGLANAGMAARVSGCGRFATAKSISGEFYVRDIFVDVDYYHDRGAP